MRFYGEVSEWAFHRSKTPNAIMLHARFDNKFVFLVRNGVLVIRIMRPYLEWATPFALIDSNYSSRTMYVLFEKPSTVCPFYLCTELYCQCSSFVSCVG